MKSLYLTILLSLAALIVSSATKNIPELKAEYYHSMATSLKEPLEARLLWYDSLAMLRSERHNQWSIEKAQLLYQSGLFEDMLQHTSKMMETLPESNLSEKFRIMYQHGQSLSMNSHVIDAIEIYENLLDLEKPDSLKYYNFKSCVGLLTIYDELNDKARSDLYAKKAEQALAKINPADITCYNELLSHMHGIKAQRLSKVGRYKEALEEIKTSLDLAKDPFAQCAAYSQIGQLFLEQKDYKAAEGYFRKSLELSSSDNNTRTTIVLLALSLLRQERHKEALDLLAEHLDDNLLQNTPRNRSSSLKVLTIALVANNMEKEALSYQNSIWHADDQMLSNLTDLYNKTVKDYLDLKDRSASLTSGRDRAVTAMWIAIAMMVLVSAAAAWFIVKARLRMNKARSMVEETDDLRARYAEAMEARDTDNRQESTSLMKIAQLSTAIDNIRHIVASRTDPQDKIASIGRYIKEISLNENAWGLFAMQFEKTNNDFISHLSSLHPDLSKTELRLCAFMLLNMPSKEIAELTNRSPRTIEVTKYRLRKKLGITEPTEVYLRRIAEEAK